MLEVEGKMAEKYEGSFVSKRALDGERDTKRFYLEQELEKVLILTYIHRLCFLNGKVFLR